MRFDGEFGTVKRRAYAYVCCGTIGEAANDRLGGVDSVRGKKLLFGGEIECRKDETAASAGAGVNFAGKRKWPTEKARSLRHVSIGNGGSDSAARNNDAAQNNRRDALDIETQTVANTAAEFAKNLNIASLAVAKAKVFSDTHGAGVHSVDEDAAYEVAGGKRGNGVVEGQDENGIEAERFQMNETLRKRFNQ